MMIPIGHGNYINTDAMLAILKPDSSPVKRLRKRAEENDRLIDATSGRKTRSLTVLSSNHVVLSSLQPEALGRKFNACTRSSWNNGQSQPPQLLFDRSEQVDAESF